MSPTLQLDHNPTTAVNPPSALSNVSDITPHVRLECKPVERTGNRSHVNWAPHDPHMARDTGGVQRLESQILKFLDELLRAFATDIGRPNPEGSVKTCCPGADFPVMVEVLW